MSQEWRPLDLRRRSLVGPFDGELIVLRRSGQAPGDRTIYEVGRLETEQGKTWFFRSGGGIYAPSAIRKRYVLSWLRLAE